MPPFPNDHYHRAQCRFERIALRENCELLIEDWPLLRIVSAGEHTAETSSITRRKIRAAQTSNDV